MKIFNFLRLISIKNQDKLFDSIFDSKNPIDAGFNYFDTLKDIVSDKEEKDNPENNKNNLTQEQ